MQHNHQRTLQALASELAALGPLILHCAISLSKQEFHLRFFSGNNSIILRCQWAAGSFFISFPEAQPVLPRKRLHWFSENDGQPVISIQSISGERILQFDFENAGILQIQAFGPNANIIFKNKEGALSSFKQKEKIAIISDAPVQDENLPMLKQFFICEKENKPPIFSLEQCENGKKYTSVMQALTDFHTQFLSVWGKNEKLIRAKVELEAKLKKHQQRMKILKERLADILNKSDYEHRGNLLMNHLHELQKGDTEATVLDYLSGKTLKIKLNPRLSPAENAEVFYRKARNSEIEQNRISAEINTLLQSEQLLIHSLQSIEKGEIPKVQTLELAGISKKNEESPHRFFELMGHRIYIGKNASNNDEITFAVAKKDDLWFHARGFGGSHVVVRRPNRNPVPRPVIEAAAMAAAFFSQGRREALCPVAYTERKYIRKPKGAAPGAVIMERETVLMVAPKNPIA